MDPQLVIDLRLGYWRGVFPWHGKSDTCLFTPKARLARYPPLNRITLLRCSVSAGNTWVQCVEISVVAIRVNVQVICVGSESKISCSTSSGRGEA